MGLPLAGRVWPIQPIGNYKDNVSVLPDAGENKLEFFGFAQRGIRNADLDNVIYNTPDQKDVFNILAYLVHKYKSIQREAAKVGLQFFGELVEEAEENPDKFPLIRMLKDVVDKNATVLCKVDGTYASVLW